MLYNNDVMKCFDLQGDYLFSVFFEGGKNGVAELHVYEQMLYYEDRHHALYRIKDDGDYRYFESFVVRESDYFQKVTHAARHSAAENGQDAAFSFKGYNLFLTIGEGEIQLTNRNFFQHLTQKNRYLYIYLMMLILSMIAVCIEKRTS